MRNPWLLRALLVCLSSAPALLWLAAASPARDSAAAHAEADVQSAGLSAELELVNGSLPDRRPLRMAYYYPVDNAAYESLTANLGRLDVVAPHWLTVDAEGGVRSTAPVRAIGALRAARAPVLPSVALTNHDAAHSVLTDDAISTRTIDSLVAAVDGWDGLALDFEGIDVRDGAALSTFIQRLGKALRTNGKQYAIALPAKTSDVGNSWSGAYDYAAIADAADLYLVMAYGFKTSGSSEPGSTAPLTWVDRSMAYAVSRIPAEKLLLGVAFYGYDWNITRGPPARALRNSDVRQLVDRLGITPTFDGESATATFRYQSDGETHEVWFEDARAVAAKLELVAKYGLRGVGAWRLGQEDPAVWDVWDRLLQAM